MKDEEMIKFIRYVNTHNILHQKMSASFILTPLFFGWFLSFVLNSELIGSYIFGFFSIIFYLLFLFIDRDLNKVNEIIEKKYGKMRMRDEWKIEKYKAVDK